MNRRSTVVLAVASVVAGLAWAVAPALASRVYAGQPVSPHMQLVFDVSDDGARLERLSFFVDLPCSRTDRMVDMGVTTAVAALPARPPVGAHLLAGGAIAGGRLDATLLTSRARGRRLLDIARGELTGTVTASQGRGTLRARRTVIERATGRVLRSCTRTMEWHAVRGPGTVFGGSTSAGAPVVLRVTRDRRRVTQSLISWTAPCRRLSRYIEPHDKWLLPFSLSAGGRFVRSYSYDAGAGGQIVGRFAGRVRARTATGTFRSRFQSRRDRCELRPQTWTARTG